MFEHLGPAMRRALAAVRASDPAGSTRILQDALRGAAQDSNPPAGSAGEAESAPRPVRPPRPRGLGDTLAALRKGASLEQLRPVREPPLPDGSAFLRRRIAVKGEAREYRLFLPSAPKPRGVLVMLHGCKQNAEDFATGTRMNMVAEAAGMLVAYPTQDHSANPSGCWNWFRPEDQQRDSGEPRILAEMTRAIIAEYALGQSVFVAGLSAGGAMAATMGATYPDLFAAIGIHSGLPHRSARDVNTALAAMRGDHRHGGLHAVSSPAAPRQIIFHGSRDHTVVPANAQALLEQARQEDGHVTEGRFTSGSRHVRHTEIIADDGTVQTELWLVEGAGHHWIGGDPRGSYAKPEGPDASREMMRFFLGQRLTR